ncbi:hypothetical protein [Bacillus sp. 7884-1]|uniref:hypothetical protein n=1 Tax=Bacillus sp. 7884-1 TaxID=2021693 RepID=UPI000BA54414|nr:hypothetical protein [Bacillus sp. 7884-1]PAE40144.1 hypothetical protein CHI06_15610 [Bacillus sp. 7884-1]
MNETTVLVEIPAVVLIGKFVFLLKNGETEEFGPFTCSKYNLENSLHIKELLADKNISNTTDQLLAKEWDFIEVDMEFEEEANPEVIYSVFQYTPETNEYYNV